MAQQHDGPGSFGPGVIRGSGRAAIVLISVAGCATSAGQRAFDDGDDVTAAKLADEAVAANPNDHAAAALRQRARDHAARRELDEAGGFRAAGHAEAALAALDRLLKQLSDWGGADALSAELRPRLDAEVAAGSAFVAQIGADEAAAGHALAAEAELARLAPLVAHAELAAAATQAEARPRDAGRATCARLQATVTPAMPHWGLAVSRYCAHFDVTFAPPPLTSAVGKLSIEGAVTGMTPTQSATLNDQLSSWVASSLWHEPTGRATARANVVGKIESSFHSQTVTLRVPYRERMVTRRDGTTAVKRSRREYVFDAEEHRGHYGMTAQISVDVGAPLSFTLQRVDVLTAYEHDASFPEADIRPTHDDVPSTDAWLRAQLEAMTAEVVFYLNRRFVAISCTSRLDTLEAAARCALAGQTPAAAVATLRRALGEDTDGALTLLRPAPTAATKSPRPAAPPDDAASPVFH